MEEDLFAAVDEETRYQVSDSSQARGKTAATKRKRRHYRGENRRRYKQRRKERQQQEVEKWIETYEEWSSNTKDGTIRVNELETAQRGEPEEEPVYKGHYSEGKANIRNSEETERKGTRTHSALDKNVKTYDGTIIHQHPDEDPAPTQGKSGDQYVKSRATTNGHSPIRDTGHTSDPMQAPTAKDLDRKSRVDGSAFPMGDCIQTRGLERGSVYAEQRGLNMHGPWVTQERPTGTTSSNKVCEITKATTVELCAPVEHHETRKANSAFSEAGSPNISGRQGLEHGGIGVNLGTHPDAGSEIGCETVRYTITFAEREQSANTNVRSIDRGSYPEWDFTADEWEAIKNGEWSFIKGLW